jgi:hypothetical protein
MATLRPPFSAMKAVQGTNISATPTHVHLVGSPTVVVKSQNFYHMVVVPGGLFRKQAPGSRTGFG